VGGSARDRVCDLALKLGLVHRWYEESRARDVVRRRTAFASLAFACVYEPCQRVGGDLLIRAVNDRDEEVRLSACRGLALAGDAEHVQDLFALAIQSDLLTRVVLTEHLRPHALALSAGPVQEALGSSDRARVRAALEILVAWERAIPLEKLCDFMEHGDREIRLLAFRLASFVAIESDSRLALLRALLDTDAGTRKLAIVAAGRHKITEAVPALELCLENGGLEEARLAASALAAMPPQGWRLLQERKASSNPSTKLAAEEALARARKVS
jgi:HEAT repeat protein